MTAATAAAGAVNSYKEQFDKVCKELKILEKRIARHGSFTRQLLEQLDTHPQAASISGIAAQRLTAGVALAHTRTNSLRQRRSCLMEEQTALLERQNSEASGGGAGAAEAKTSDAHEEMAPEAPAAAAIVKADPKKVQRCCSRCLYSGCAIL